MPTATKQLYLNLEPAVTTYSPVCVACRTNQARIDRQYPILRLARFTEPLPDNKRACPILINNITGLFI